MTDHGGPAYRFRTYPFFVGGIILFFLTNGYSQYVQRISLEPMLLFGVLWVILAYGLLNLLNRGLRSVHRAGIMTGYLLICYLFFGDIHAGFTGFPVLNRFRAVLVLLLAVGVVL